MDAPTIIALSFLPAPIRMSATWIAAAVKSTHATAFPANQKGKNPAASPNGMERAAYIHTNRLLPRSALLAPERYPGRMRAITPHAAEARDATRFRRRRAVRMNSTWIVDQSDAPNVGKGSVRAIWDGPSLSSRQWTGHGRPVDFAHPDIALRMSHVKCISVRSRKPRIQPDTNSS